MLKTTKLAVDGDFGFNVFLCFYDKLWTRTFYSLVSLRHRLRRRSLTSLLRTTSTHTDLLSWLRRETGSERSDPGNSLAHKSDPPFIKLKILPFSGTN